MSSLGSPSKQPAFDNPQYFIQKYGGGDEWHCNLCTHDRDDHIDYMSSQKALAHERTSPEHARNISEAQMWWNPVSDPDAWCTPLPAQQQQQQPSSRLDQRYHEHRYFNDHLGDLIPFWIRGVEAAEKGEVLKWETFLDSMDDLDGCEPAKAKNPWSNPGSDSGNKDGWGWVSRDDENAWGNAAWGNAEPSKDAGGWGTSLTKRWDSPQTQTTPRHSVKKGKGRGNPQRNDKTSRREQDNTHTFVEDIARQRAADAERTHQMQTFFDMPTNDKVKKIDELIRDLRAAPT